MNETKQTRLVTFTLDHQRYAVNLSAVERIVPAAEVTPLPQAPGIVLGVINVQGQILPVFNIRRRFGLPERDMDLNDKLIIANTPRRTVVLVVDSATGVIERAEHEVTAAENILPNLKHLEGAAPLEDEIVLIHDLDRFLSLEEERSLTEAISRM